MLELLNSLVQGLNAKDLQLNKELEDLPTIEENNVYMVEFFGVDDNVESEMIIAKNNTQAWLRAIMLGLEIKNIYRVEGHKKILITSNDVDVDIINHYIEKLEEDKKNIVLHANVDTISQAIQILDKYSMTVKDFRFLNDRKIELVIYDKYANYMFMHFKENTCKLFD